MEPVELTRAIVAECTALGFHRVGVIPVAPAERHAVFEAWLDAGRHGDMAYLAAPGARAARRDVRALLPSARTVVVAALSYAGPTPAAPPGRGKIARYALGADYHMVLKQKLGVLAERVEACVGHPVAALVCVDTAHVLERDLGERAAVGFVGKNTLLIAPGLGSYLVVGELLLDVAAAPTSDEPAAKRCGECRLCLDACPTGAFVGAHVLDARRCISYLTIEHRGVIPRQLRPLIGAMIFGCDVCQDVCPFNAAPHAGAPELAPARPQPDLVELLALGASQFRRFVKRTALRRIHRAQLLRNVCVALGNVGDVSAVGPLQASFDREGPLVRVHAAWALGRLSDGGFLSARRVSERDPDVREEIDVTLGDLGL
jgi:epoxyqueuosine reductase